MASLTASQAEANLLLAFAGESQARKEGCEQIARLFSDTGDALREKQIQQNYRPIIAIHKWLARREPH